MSRTIVTTFSVSEQGSVTAMTHTDDSFGTSEPHKALSLYGAPYLMTYETSEDWRDALMRYASDDVREVFDVGYPHGSRVAYVSPGCSVYVIETDFDSVVPHKFRPYDPTGFECAEFNENGSCIHSDHNQAAGL